MALETATYLDSLVTSNPAGGDQASTADDHIRLLKACLQRTFPNVAGEVSASAGALNQAGDFANSASSTLEWSRMKFVTKDTNESRSATTTIAQDASLTGLVVLPNKHYRLRALIGWRHLGGGIGFNIDPSAAAQHGVWRVHAVNTVSTAQVYNDGAWATLIGNFNFNPSTYSISSVFYTIVEAEFKSHLSNTASLSLKWAQSSSVAAATVVYSGSAVELLQRD